MKPKNALATFCTVAVTAGWAGVLLDRVAHTPASTQGPGMLFWLTAPLATAAVLRWRTGGWRDAGLRPGLRRNARHYATGLAIPFVVGGGAIALASITGRVAVNWDTRSYLALVASTLGFNLIKNVFEEFAWRGYLSSKLDAAGHSDRTVYLVTGLIWGLWHLPYYLFLLDGNLMTSTLDVPGPVFALLAMGVLMGWSVVQVELFRQSGSVWVPLLLHSIHNTFIDPIAAQGFVSMPTGVGLLFSPIVGVGTTVGWLTLGLWLRQRRLAVSLAQPDAVAPAPHQTSVR